MAEYVWASDARLLGAGADGEVRVGFHQKTGDKVAMKKMYEHEYLYDTIINESEILEELGEHDIKAVMRQILEGLAWIHAHRIVHQDIKTSNVLVKRDGEKNKFVVKLADFTTARRLQTRPWSNKVGTLTFNAPELLKGATSFGTAIDVWSAGCIFEEMLLGSNPFDVPDEEDGDSLNYFVADFAKKLDIDGCGMGYQDRRRERARERILQKMAWWKAEDVRSRIKDPNAVELLKRMLAIDPARRISAQNALKMPYFQEKAEDTIVEARRMLPTMTIASGNLRPAWLKINNTTPSIAIM
ncbi:cyclin-dependent kinase A-1 [Selaginella moellendorffii]|uniref:cyclin-dependent kinase A-1 n=1 Tax=Selaginella moellendorffii TaxID=88036 RepID=UPI000D1CA06C|nr:cyclin-dependent kinase A-1 [Selaginella moellendorffii]|eukprot:XP_024530216.1 cyclin-dependent kinase A-1 [Selaginella moellendorffii]